MAAALIAGTQPVAFAAVVGAVVLAATVANLMMLPHPTWFAFTGVAGVVVAAYIAGKAVAIQV